MCDSEIIKNQITWQHLKQYNSKSGRHIKAVGTTNIKIKIHHNSDNQHILIAYCINPNEIDKSGEILPCNPEADSFNFQIGEIIQNYRRAILNIGSTKLR